ncbi:hypothetical protein D046_2001B, partial [Vibrio parahaemolyticus V-223/04]
APSKRSNTSTLAR